MEAPPYDHRDKCGNEGDVVKHVGLLAAVDGTLATWRRPVVRYADTFAGYAQCVLGEGGEWTYGAGLLADRERLRENPHTACWQRWYLSRPVLRGTAYPGSSRIAADVARDREVPIRLSLWDVSETAVRSLRATWGDRASVFARPADPTEAAVVEADFLFVDPPDLGPWPAIQPMLERERSGGSLLWLPVLSRGDEPIREAVETARSLDYAVAEVGWAPHGRNTVGCRLVHRLSESAGAVLTDAVEHVARLAGWVVRPVDA